MTIGFVSRVCDHSIYFDIILELSDTKTEEFVNWKL